MCGRNSDRGAWEIDVGRVEVGFVEILASRGRRP
jgi:hypothetical protein